MRARIHGDFGMSRTGSGEAGKGRRSGEFDAVTQAVADFARAGQQRWRKKRIGLAPLLNLESVQAELNPQDVSTDARRDAVERAIKAAIERLPDPERAATIAYFGFDGGNPNHTDRQNRAGALLGLTGRWFRGKSSEYPPSPREYVIALVAESLAGGEDPLATDPKEGASVEPPAPGSPAAGDPEPDGSAGVLVAMVLVLALALLVEYGGLGNLVSWPGGEKDPIPPRGAIVDARTGEVFAARLVRPLANSRGLAWRDILWACDRDSEDCDRSELARRRAPLKVGPGDTIDFRVRLYDPHGEPVSVLRLAAAPVRAPERTFVRLSIEWPVKARRAGEGLGMEAHHDAVALQLPRQASLVYDEGSTMLYGSAGEEAVVAHLPEGIMDPPGIKLRDVGSPRDCWDCNLESVRYVGFEATVE